MLQCMSLLHRGMSLVHLLSTARAPMVSSFVLTTTTTSLTILLLLLPSVLDVRCTAQDFLHDRRAYETTHHGNRRVVVNIQHLLPTSVCSSSSAAASAPATRGIGRRPDGAGVLELSHLHGPCSPVGGGRSPSHEQILSDDQTRVDLLHRRASTSNRPRGRKAGDAILADSEIAARSGTSMGTGNYIVTVGFGSPKKDQSVIIDTGSDVSWIQCRPCASCYQQLDPVFDPSQSSTYANVSCSSRYCTELDVSSGCGSPATCLYTIEYVDNSYSVGFLAQDTLTLGSYDVVPNFRFGCGEQNRGRYGKAAGLLGLGRQDVSLLAQTYQKYGGVFSYCLPPTSSSRGYLAFGSGGGGYYGSSNFKFTPMLSDVYNPTFYYLSLIGISVDGKQLPVTATVFSTAGTIIDSGTVITRLPPAAYSALRSAFRKAMTRYKSASALAILDTCYDFTSYGSATIPAVELQFDGGVTMDLDPSGILYVASASQACLAFAAISEDDDLSVLGNVQQRSFNVVYDLARRVIGFGPGGC